MSREIGYRAKDGDGNWVYGFVALVSIAENVHCWKMFNFNNGVAGTSIDPKTIGQYTGIRDKNGVKIYECDEFMDLSSNEYGLILKDSGKACFMAKIDEHLYDDFGSTRENIIPMHELYFDEIEVIGNIHEDKK